MAPSGAGFTQVSAAIQSASDGDVILVRPGTYAGFALDRRALTIVSDAGTTPFIQGAVSVRNVPAGQCVTLAGLRIAGASDSALALENNSGGVRIVDVQAWIWPNSSSSPPPACRIENCADVALSACGLTGAPLPTSLGVAGTALRVRTSHVALDQCTVTGSAGLSGATFSLPGGWGGVGCALESGELFASATSFVGGAGGAGGTAPTGQQGCAAQVALAGGSGGDGLDVTSPATARVLACTFAAGSGANGGTTSCGVHGTVGANGVALAGTVTTLAASARAFTAARTAREGANLTLHLAGVPGEHVVLFLSQGSGQSFDAAHSGCVLVANPFLRRFSLGIVPASGTFDVGLPVAELGPGVAARVLHIQALFVGGVSSELGGARVVTFLDSAY